MVRLFALCLMVVSLHLPAASVAAETGKEKRARIHAALINHQVSFLGYNDRVVFSAQFFPDGKGILINANNTQGSPMKWKLRLDKICFTTRKTGSFCAEIELNRKKVLLIERSANQSSWREWSGTLRPL